MSEYFVHSWICLLETNIMSVLLSIERKSLESLVTLYPSSVALEFMASRFWFD